MLPMQYYIPLRAINRLNFAMPVRVVFLTAREKQSSFININRQNRDSVETLSTQEQPSDGRTSMPHPGTPAPRARAQWQPVCPYLLGQETDVTGRRILPGCLLLREPLQLSRNQTLVVPSVE